MRVPYAPSTPSNEADKVIYDRIAVRRAPRPLIPLDLALLHNPAVADGWNSFIGAIRTKTSLHDSYKEIAIARVAVLNHAVHEWDVHAALALKAGVSKEGMQFVLDSEVYKSGQEEKFFDAAMPLQLEQRHVLAYTDQMTIGVVVDKEISLAMKDHFSDTEVVELTATIAAYNCVSRFLVALDVGEMNDRRMKSVDELLPV